MTRIAEEKMNRVNGGSLLSGLEKGLSPAFKCAGSAKFDIGDQVVVKKQLWMGTGVVMGVIDADRWQYEVLINRETNTYYEDELDWA